MSYFYRVEEDDTSFQRSVYKCLLCFGVEVCVLNTTCGCVLFVLCALCQLICSSNVFVSKCVILFVSFWLLMFQVTSECIEFESEL